MPVATPIIEVDRLTYDYPGRRALDNVTLTLARGSITALVGPNGAGKTTLLRCIAGLDRPLTGNIRVNGIDVVEEPRLSHEYIGYLSDFFGLYDDLSVRQCLTYVAAANRSASANLPGLVEEVAVEIGLSERLEQQAGSLSRGLRQRVAIAQAVIHRPSVILLDEPASGLDPEARYLLGELFLSLRKSGLSLLVSSHILAELEAYSTDMLILRDGRVVEQRRLDAGVTDACLMELSVTTGNDTALAALNAHALVSMVVATPDSIQFHFGGDAQQRAGLLNDLVSAGIGVCHFALVVEDLQQSYLRSINHRASTHES